MLFFMLLSGVVGGGLYPLPTSQRVKTSCVVIVFLVCYPQCG